MMTSLGEIVFELDNIKAPKTTENFLKYVSDGFYADTVFHRIMSSFMVQGGGYNYTAATQTFTLKPSTYAAIALEAPSATGLSNIPGTIAMARTSVLNSATSQFFVNVVDNSSQLDSLSGGYAVFGQMISGLDTLVAIRDVKVSDNGLGEKSMPATPPVIQWVIRLK